MARGEHSFIIMETRKKPETYPHTAYSGSKMNHALIAYMDGDPLSDYRAYVKSEHWAVRKELYFQMHNRECAICGSPYVELNHLFYDQFGQEQDMDLIPLCRADHQAFHFAIPMQKDMRESGRRFIEQEKRKRLLLKDKHIKILVTLQGEGLSAGKVVEKVARPIWKMLALLGVKV